jgi:hypothetical protein
MRLPRACVAARSVAAGALLSSVVTCGPSLARDVPIAPNQVLCFDLDAVAHFIQRVSSECSPIAPPNRRVEIREVNSNSAGNRVVQVQVVRDGRVVGEGYTLEPASAVTRAPAKPAVPKTAPSPGIAAPVVNAEPTPSQKKIAAVAPPATQPVERAVPAEPQRVDYDDRIVGNWMTSAKEDRFGDGGTFAAMTGDGGIALAVRCLQKNLSIGVIEIGSDPKPMEKGDLFLFKFRVDTQPVVETGGVAIGDRLIQLVTEKALVKAIRDGKETAMRIEDKRGATSTHVFDTAGSRRAFADLSRECPLD